MLLSVKGDVMELAEKKAHERLVQTSLRLPAHIREKARKAAEAQSRNGVIVREAEVYRDIIENFFAQSATDCMRDGIEGVA